MALRRLALAAIVLGAILIPYLLLEDWLLGTGAAFSPEAAPGFIAALGCALVWSLYSVTSKRMAAVPTEARTVTPAAHVTVWVLMVDTFASTCPLACCAI